MLRCPEWYKKNALNKMAFSIDNETLAVAVIIGAAALYYFTHEQKTDSEVKSKRDEDRKGIAIRNLDILERRFDALELEDLPKEKQLPKHIEESLAAVLEDAIVLQSRSSDIDLDEAFFEHCVRLIQSSRVYLNRHDEEVADIEAHNAHQGGVCPTKNVAVVNKIAVTHNHFDQRQQALSQQQTSINVFDGRSLNFQTQNNEMRQLFLTL